MIAFDEFKKVNLLIAQVVAAERIPKTDKLLKLEVDLGDERRTIVAGIAQFYEATQLVGKQIVMVANLEPARLRGVESNGMLLAASDKITGKVVLLAPLEPMQPGSSVS